MIRRYDFEDVETGEQFDAVVQEHINLDQVVTLEDGRRARRIASIPHAVTPDATPFKSRSLPRNCPGIEHTDDKGNAILHGTRGGEEATRRIEKETGMEVVYDPGFHSSDID